MGLAGRHIQADGKRDWRVSVRLGPNASGEGATGAKAAKSAPPAPRENLGPRADGQIYYLPTMNPNTLLGRPRMGYRSSEEAVSSSEANGRLLVRLAGTTSRAHSATKQDLAQGAKVGHCACYAGVTQVVLPPAYALGGYDTLNAEGLSPWEKFGPWPPRRLAVHHFAATFGSLPSTCGWAAASLYVHAPDALLRAPFAWWRNDFVCHGRRTPATSTLGGPKNWHRQITRRFPDVPLDCVGRVRF